MEYLAFVYTLLLVAICLMMAVLLARTSRLLKEPKDDEALKSWLEQQLAAQAKDFSARQDAVAQQNYAAIRSVSETLQTAVQGMSTTLGQGQDSQQRILEQRLRSLEQANTQQMEPMPVIAGLAKYPEDLVDKMRAKGIKVDAMDCLALADQAGSSKAVNMVLMGRLSHYIPNIPAEAWQASLEANVPAKVLELNKVAFALGQKG